MGTFWHFVGCCRNFHHQKYLMSIQFRWPVLSPQRNKHCYIPCTCTLMGVKKEDQLTF